MIVLFLGLGCAGCNDDERDSGSWPAGDVPCEPCGGECVQTYTEATAASHVDGDVEYPDEPPSSGDHNSCWAAWGVHTEQVAAENWVHNLEHGGVAVLHDCPGGCPDEVAQLVAWVESLPAGRAILSPYAPADYPFTAVSWEHRLELACFDLAALQEFFNQNVGHAPEDLTADPASSCM